MPSAQNAADTADSFEPDPAESSSSLQSVLTSLSHWDWITCLVDPIDLVALHSVVERCPELFSLIEISVRGFYVDLSESLPALRPLLTHLLIALDSMIDVAHAQKPLATHDIKSLATSPAILSVIRAIALYCEASTDVFANDPAARRAALRTYFSTINAGAPSVDLMTLAYTIVLTAGTCFVDPAPQQGARKRKRGPVEVERRWLTVAPSCVERLDATIKLISQRPLLALASESMDVRRVIARLMVAAIAEIGRIVDPFRQRPLLPYLLAAVDQLEAVVRRSIGSSEATSERVAAILDFETMDTRLQRIAVSACSAPKSIVNPATWCAVDDPIAAFEAAFDALTSSSTDNVFDLPTLQALLVIVEKERAILPTSTMAETYVSLAVAKEVRSAIVVNCHLRPSF